jgi:hypothetical protein
MGGSPLDFNVVDEGIVISAFVATSRALIDSPFSANPILKAIQADGIAI